MRVTTDSAVVLNDVNIFAISPATKIVLGLGDPRSGIDHNCVVQRKMGNVVEASLRDSGCHHFSIKVDLADRTVSLTDPSYSRDQRAYGVTALVTAKVAQLLEMYAAKDARVHGCTVPLREIDMRW